MSHQSSLPYHKDEFATADLEKLELCEGCGSPLSQNEEVFCSQCDEAEPEPIQLLLI